MDPTGHDTLARALAYGHPAVMVLALVLAGLALRAGLRMRRRRVGRLPAERGLLAIHLRVAKPAVLVLLVGFTLGPLSAAWLRDFTPFGTFHAWLGILAAVLFGGAGWLGRGLERGRARDRARAARLHGRLGAVAMLVAALTAAAGFVLLP